MIEVIRTNRFERREPIDGGVSGNYYIYDKRRNQGIKIFGGFYTLKELKGDKVFRDAKNELKCLKRAYKHKLCPKPYKLVIIKSQEAYHPAVIMEHIKGGTLYEFSETNYGSADYDVMLDKRDALKKKLSKIGIRHNDLHTCNVVVKEYKRCVKYLAIDFAYAKIIKRRR